jgi:hypothetical protein
MDNGVDLIFTQDAFLQRTVTNVASDNLDPFDPAFADQLALRDPVTHKADHVCTRLDQALHKPGANQACPTRNVRGTVNPKLSV